MTEIVNNIGRLLAELQTSSTLPQAQSTTCRSPEGVHVRPGWFAFLENARPGSLAAHIK